MIEIRPVLYVVGLLLAAVAVFMLLPAALDVAQGSDQWPVFALAAAFTGFVGVGLALTCRTRNFVPDIRQAFLLTTLCWVASSAFGALPFLFYGHGLSYADAVFETVSGLTTTGSSVLSNLNSLPRGLLLWRSLLNWIGGVGIVVVAIIILPFLRVGGMQLFRTESSDRSEKVAARPVEMVRYILTTYLVLSVACAFAYWVAGMSTFDAINHAMATVATGGFSTYDESFARFREPAIHWIAVAFMFAGALPMTAFIRTLQGRDMPIWRDSQVQVFFWLVVLVSAGIGLWLWLGTALGFEEALRVGTFNVVSIITTTGFAIGDYQLWGPPAIGLFLILTFIGGCTGSTSGAIKIFRFQVLWIMTRAYLRQLMRPHGIEALHYQGRRISDEVSYSVLAFVVAYAGCWVVLTLALAADGLDLVTALSGAATAISNVGPGLGHIIGPVGNFESLSDTAKWLLSFGMLLGRLELFTLLVLLQRSFWRW